MVLISLIMAVAGVVLAVKLEAALAFEQLCEEMEQNIKEKNRLTAVKKNTVFSLEVLRAAIAYEPHPTPLKSRGISIDYNCLRATAFGVIYQRKR